MKALMVVVLMVCAAPVWAARMVTTFTMPDREALVVGTDTCGPGTAPETSPMTARRCYAGPLSACDSLVNQAPGTAVQMFAAVPTGMYTITVDTRDNAGNWSCPVSITKMIRGKPARITDLGFNYWRTVLREYLASAYTEERDGREEVSAWQSGRVRSADRHDGDDARGERDVRGHATETDAAQASPGAASGQASASETAAEGILKH